LAVVPYCPTHKFSTLEGRISFLPLSGGTSSEALDVVGVYCLHFRARW